MLGILKALKEAVQSVPGYRLFSLAVKEINLIKTQKIALALILLYPVIVIGTLGMAFSGSSGISNVDVAFYAPPDLKGFDTNGFISKINQTKTVNLIMAGSEGAVKKAIMQRRARVGLVVHEPESTNGRFVVDLLSDNSNIVSSEFFFQLAYNSIRRVGFETSREALNAIWQNLTKIKSGLGAEVERVDGFMQQLDESKVKLLDLKKSVNEIDLADLRQKLAKQEDSIVEMGKKIDAVSSKANSFTAFGDTEL
ncbi:Uncharacterised protein [uncultured archaeon]|nr:Uncharacterised protein [uncultured archaeon]